MAIGVNWKEIWADVWGPVWQSTPPVLVPDVVGQSQASGTAELEADGFVVAVENAYSSTVPAGDIISQSPSAGSSVLNGSTVTITVSLGEAPQPEPSDEVTGGGWALFIRYEQERERRRRRKRKEEEAKEALEQLPEVEKEIGEFLQKQEREDERRKDLERLKSLAREFPKTELPKRVQSAIDRVNERQTISSLINLEKELRKLAEEEEIAILMLLLND